METEATGVMSYRERRKLQSGAGDAFAKAFELVATPAIFGLGGWFVDSRLGIFPVVTLMAVCTVFGYEVWRFTRDYGISMDEALESRRAGYASHRSAASDGGMTGGGDRLS